MISLGDKKIVEKIIKRDYTSLLKFYRSYNQLIFRYIYHRVRDFQIAEEITQDVFLEFVESLRSFRYQSSLKTFIYSIAKYKTIDYLRKKKIKQVLFSALPNCVVEGLKFVLVDDEINRRDLERRIEQTLNQLPNVYQRILRLKYLENNRVSEIAKQLKLKFKATESLLFRARKAFIKVFIHL